ncbi:MAG TPA: FAD-dependent oxidoreductase [Gemmatimonadaceae bacterium]|nr:FAD-dependent oxidoreductase [Gemmatimonadaceae bacterium]
MLESDLEADHCVIGLGGSGLSCIRELLALGGSVIGIDAAQVAAGAAGRNGGILRPGVAAFHHDAVRAIGRERAIRINQLTIDEIGRFAADTPGAVRITGWLRLAVSEEDYGDCLAERDALLEDGFHAEAYDGPFGRGLALPDGASFQPLERCRALARDVTARGAQLYEQTRALSFARDEVRTPRGRIRCASVVIAVDGGLESLVPELGGTVRTARLQMLATAPASEVNIPCPVSLNFGFDYAQQLPNGVVVAGGGRDREMDAEWTGASVPTPGIQAHLDRLIRVRLGVRAPVTHRWAANVSYTTTGLPVLAQVRPGVWVIGGYSGTGNLLGALAGRAAARASCGEQCEFASLLARPTARA